MNTLARWAADRYTSSGVRTGLLKPLVSIATLHFARSIKVNLMSSSPQREPLSGLIRQDDRVVGAICLPEFDVDEFIDEFNRCYGPVRLHIDQPEFKSKTEARLFPVGARRATEAYRRIKRVRCHDQHPESPPPSA